jgi:hypothetical protein
MVRRWIRVFAGIVAVLAAAPALGKRGRDGRAEVRGIVASRPEGRSGEWVVGGRAFVADSRTELDTSEGPLAVGACAKVRYVRADGTDVAIEIDSEPARDCADSSSE